MVSWQFGDNYDQAAGLKLTHTKQRGARFFFIARHKIFSNGSGAII
jgi:hypothetical protein